MALSALVLAGALSLVRLPSPEQLGPLLELVIELSRPRARVESAPVPPPQPQEEEQPAVETAVPAPARAERVAEPAPAVPEYRPRTRTQWEELRDEAITQVLDAEERERAYTVNPPFTRARQVAAVRFRASLAPEERHIWDNVEKDQLGRTILRDGNCFHVLDDPSAVNREVFETFDQYTVYCDFVFGQRGGTELPWVEIVRERYPYLRDPVEVP